MTVVSAAALVAALLAGCSGAGGAAKPSAEGGGATKAPYRIGADPNIFTAHAYDAIHIITDALTRIPGDATPQALRDEIEKTTSFVGLDGTFTFSATDHNGLSENDLVMYVVRDGKWVLAK